MKEFIVQREINGRPVIETPHGPVLTPCAPGSVLARLGDKWTILVVSMLALAPHAPMRFGAIRRGIPDISQRMLTLTLRSLERDGLVARHYYPEVPPRVEYELTTRGKSMLQPLAAFTNWIKDTWQDIEASRQEFDQSERSGTSAVMPWK
ncbi:helix-turn-helix domain-containing protein [Neorhizobium sp. T6_25]|uniref:winged helix-turn-helix transcriptional regulator n=1 Tax=Neorhizobium sp. T6_25 TaxID=2093833 RepID=UPI001FE095C8|nr:helix-turn-helix domain-containing protein [Neorhizobium sp. T6_25]